MYLYVLLEAKIATITAAASKINPKTQHINGFLDWLRSRLSLVTYNFSPPLEITCKHISY